MGAGLSGKLALSTPSLTTADPAEAQSLLSLEDVAVAPGVAPWVAARAGLPGSNEGGVTYTGRSVRVDARHAFDLDGAALSLGLGGSVLLRDRAGGDPDSSGVTGGGLDLPVLFGWTSQSEIYTIWVGPRGGFEVLTTRVQPSEPAEEPEEGFLDVDARHFHVGAVLGLRVGFRHVHVAVEVNGAYHHADGTIQDARSAASRPAIEASLDEASITPSGALIITF